MSADQRISKKVRLCRCSGKNTPSERPESEAAGKREKKDVTNQGISS